MTLQLSTVQINMKWIPEATLVVEQLSSGHGDATWTLDINHERDHSVTVFMSRDQVIDLAAAAIAALTGLADRGERRMLRAGILDWADRSTPIPPAGGRSLVDDPASSEVMP